MKCSSSASLSWSVGRTIVFDSVYRRRLTVLEFAGGSKLTLRRHKFWFRSPISPVVTRASASAVPPPSVGAVNVTGIAAGLVGAVVLVATPTYPRMVTVYVAVPPSLTLFPVGPVTVMPVGVVCANAVPGDAASSTAAARAVSR